MQLDMRGFGARNPVSVEMCKTEDKTGQENSEGEPPKHHKVPLRTRKDNVVIRTKRTLRTARGEVGQDQGESKEVGMASH